MTELTGEAGTGKTQLCLSAAASAAALGHRVVYVDTGACFSASRVKEFHRGFVTDDADGAEVEQHLNLTLDLITVLRVHDVFELFKALEELGLGLAGDPGAPGDGGLEGEREFLDIGGQLGLLVIDSLSSLLSPVLTRAHHQGYTVMAAVGALLRSLAPAHDCAVLYTNHTVSGGYVERGAVSIKPCWHSMDRTPHRRLFLSRNTSGREGVPRVVWAERFADNGQVVGDASNLDDDGADRRAQGRVPRKVDDEDERREGKGLVYD